MSGGLFCLDELEESTDQLRDWFSLLIIFFYFILKRNIHLSNANIVNPDQKLDFAASDLGLQCLPVSYFLGH